MGLRPLDLADWLPVDDRRSEELRLKAELLDRTPEEVVAALPGTEEAAAEVLELVVDHLERHHPGVLRRDGTGWVDAPTGVGGGDHPIDAAARLVQEDLCLMTRPEGGPWVLGAASVCFPSRWSLRSKVGRDLSAIHAPVPGYEATIGAPTAATFDRLRPERPMWRSNWTLLDDPALPQPEAAGRARRRTPPDDPGTTVWLRVERQTLRRLERSPSVLFTIRTTVTRLDAAGPEVHDALRVALAEVPAEVDAYKGWQDLRPAVLRWLDRAAGALTTPRR